VVLAQMVAVPENEVSVTQHHRGSLEDGLIESSRTLWNLMQEILFNNVDSDKACSQGNIVPWPRIRMAARNVSYWSIELCGGHG